MRLEFESEDIWRIEAILEAPTNLNIVKPTLMKLL